MRSILVSLVLAACVASPDASDDRDGAFLVDGKADSGISAAEAAGVLAVVNALSEDQLRDDVGLSDDAASNIAARGSTFQTLAELDAVPYVGVTAFRKLLAYARANGYVNTPATVGTGKLLDCNTPVGPDQQVTVIGDGTTLTLRELTTSGAQVERSLSLHEWASNSLRLRDDFGSTTTLTKGADGWVVRSSGGGFSEIGNADCWVDKSP